MDVQPELGTSSKWGSKMQRDRSLFLQTANVIKSFIGFCFPSFTQQLNCNYARIFFSLLLEGEESYYSSIYQFRHENENVYLLLLQRLSV